MAKNQRIQRQQRKQRRLNRERANFTRPLTGRQARHVAGAEAGMEYNPVIRQKKGEIRGSVKREHELGSAYNALAAQNAQAQAIAAKAYEAGEAATTARLTAAGQADQAAAQQLAAQDQQTSQLLGGPANTEGMRTVALGNSAIAAQRNTLAAPLTTAGANNVAYLGSTVNTAHLAGFKAKERQRGETRAERQKLEALKREKGQGKVTRLNELRKQEVDRGIANRAFRLERRQQGFSEKMGRNENRRQNEAQRNANQEQKNQNRAARQPNVSGSGKGGLTPSERRGIREGRQNAMSTARSAIKTGGWPKTPKEWAQLEQAVAAQSEISPADARYAIQKLRHKRERMHTAEATGKRTGF
jgi:hypothetical protein